MGQTKEFSTIKEGHGKPAMMPQTALGRGPVAYQEYEERRLAATDDSPQPKDEQSPATEESWAYKHLVPPLWKPKGNPSRDWAEGVLKNKLEEWGRAFVDSPDPVATPIQEFGKWRKIKQKEL